MITGVELRRKDTQRCSFNKKLKSKNLIQLPRPVRQDEAAFDVSVRSAQYWMRFFASLRMTGKVGLGGRASIFGRAHVRAYYNPP
jgi:hypothetical protein